MHDVLLIPFVYVKFVTRGGLVRKFATYNSAQLFLRLRRAGMLRERVGLMREEGSILESNSLLALNAYLRTAQAPRGGRFPFFRLNIRGDTSRHGWAMFKSYLGLQFL